MQFKVPQNVQMEDKIVGPLTLRQLIICAVGGGISYGIYVSLAKAYVMAVWLPATAVPALLTIAIAFLKIKDLPFWKFLLLEAEKFIIPMKRSFIKGGGEAHRSVLSQESEYQKKDKHEKKIQSKSEYAQEKMEKLDNLAKLLDTKGEMDIKPKEETPN